MKTACHQFKTPEEIQAQTQTFHAPEGKQQIWGCKECRVAKRVYGEGRPEPGINYEPLIGCRFCGKLTRHIYIGIQEAM